MGARKHLLMLLMVLVAGTGPAAAADLVFVLDPRLSFVSIDPNSAITADLGPLLPAGSARLETQVGAGGSGGTLPDGTMSDGLRTSLTGRLVVRLALLQGVDSIDFLHHPSSFSGVDSGSWLPGLPGTTATAAPGELAALLSQASLGLVGRIAIRNTVLGVTSFNAEPLTDQGGGRFVFELPFFVGVLDGVLDYELGLPGLRGRTPLATANAEPDRSQQGLLEYLGDVVKLTLPLSIALRDRLPSGFARGIPLGVDVTLSGQLVAFYPEIPGLSPCTERGLDLDGDGVCGDDDNCPDTPNPSQRDSGGLNSAAPDGTGDACQCGDGNDDARVDVLDVVVERRAQNGRPPGIAAPGKCNTVGPQDASNPDTLGVAPDCLVDDVARVREALAGLPPGIEPVCAGQPEAL